MQILGVRIDEFTRQQTLQRVSEFLNSTKSHTIFTPNPEMLVDAQKDEYFKRVLNESDLNVCDGFGLSLVSGVERYPGVDLMQDICALAEKEGKSIYLLGSGSDEIVKKTATKLNKKYSNLKIVGHNKGPKIELRVTSYELLVTNEEKNDEILHDIIMTAPDILFVAFGHGKQEKWINENLPHLPSVRVAMGVGGAFDFISGHIKRAPRLIRKIGLEWLYRLIQEPRRIGRIFKATVLFIYCDIFKK